MPRFKKLFLGKSPFSCLALLVALVFTLTLPGCGGGGGGSRGSGEDVMIIPPANRAPTAGRAFADISLIHESGNPGRWRSDSLDTHFSDPDSDSLSYTANSSNQSVARAAIGESKPPILVVETHSAGSAVITVTAADSGGLTASQSFTVTVDESTASPPDHPDTPADATPITLDTPFTGRIDSPTDVDYFRLPIDKPGKLIIRTTGGANPDIAVFDADGVEIPGTPGSWVVSITPAILSIRLFVYIRFSSGNPGQDYSGNVTFESNPAQSWGAVGAIPDQKLARRSTTGIVLLSQYFSYPRPTDLRFSAMSADPGLVNILFGAPGAHSFGLFSHSRLGSTSVTVTAVDPNGQTATQTFTVTVENKAPVAKRFFPSINNLLNFAAGSEFYKKLKFDLDYYFTDPDDPDDELTYSVKSSNPGAVQADVSHLDYNDIFGNRHVEKKLELTWHKTARDSSITVTAKDSHGASVTQTFLAGVRNHAPSIIRDAVPDPLTLTVEVCKTVSLELSGFFEDPDGDEEIAFGRPPYVQTPGLVQDNGYPRELYDRYRYLKAKANLEGTTLIITGISPGHTTHSVLAYNPHAYEPESNDLGFHTAALYPEVEIEVTGEEKECDPERGDDNSNGGDDNSNGGDDNSNGGDGILRSGAYIMIPRLFVSVSHPTYEENAAAVLQECEAQRNPDEESCNTVPAGIMSADICLAEAAGELVYSNETRYYRYYIGSSIDGSVQQAENNALDSCRNDSHAEPETCRIVVSGICGFGP